MQTKEIAEFYVAQIGLDGGVCFCCGKKCEDRRFLHAMKVHPRDREAVAKIFEAAGSQCTLCSREGALLVSACDQHRGNLEVLHELAYTDVLTAEMVAIARDHGEFLASFLLFEHNLTLAQHQQIKTSDGWAAGRNAARAEFKRHLEEGVPGDQPLNLYME